MVVIGEDLFGAGNVARRTFQVNGIGSQVDIDIQAVFQQAQIFVPRAEKSLDVGADFNALLHLWVLLVFDALLPALDAQWPVQEVEFVSCNPIRPTGRQQSSLLRDKLFSCLEVEPAEGARPEVQATAITVKGTPARG